MLGLDSTSEFDWLGYIERYPDIAAAGIDTRDKALEHWLSYGREEGRWAGAPPRPKVKAMSCDSMHSVFLRSWGAIVCWDDAGSSHELQPFDPTIDYANDVYLGPVFNKIRSSLRADRMPFPEHCSRCICLRLNGDHRTHYQKERELELFQVEPSYRCTLDCPGCVRQEVRRHAPRPHDLRAELLDKLLGDFARAGVTIRRFSFQGHGEPTAHRGLARLAEIVKLHYPGGYLAACTNAQAEESPELAHCGIDEWVCSVDGVDQSSFESYRRNGDFRRSIRFMSTLCRERNLGAPIRVVWRYILFEHNDSKSDLQRLARIASEIGVDAVVLVFTENGPSSRRWRSSADLPPWTGNVPVEVRRHGASVDDLDRRLARAQKDAANGHRSKADELVDSVGRMIDRFWPKAHRRTVDQQRVVETFRETLQRSKPANPG